VCTVDSKDFNIQPEGAEYFCFCQTSAPDWIGWKCILRANSDLWRDVGALQHPRGKAAQHRMTSQGVSTTQKILRHSYQLARSWHVCFAIHVDFLPHCVTLMHSIRVNCFAVLCIKRFRRKNLGKCQRWSSYCMTALIHIYSRFDKGDIGNSGLGSHESPSLHPWLGPQWFSFVWTSEGAVRRTEISNWWWSQTLCLELAAQLG
jgi:hypothetical protein